MGGGGGGHIAEEVTKAVYIKKKNLMKMLLSNRQTASLVLAKAATKQHRDRSPYVMLECGVGGGALLEHFCGDSWYP